MTATFLLIRHAAHVQLDRTLSGRTAGVPLSDAGAMQADALGRRLARDPLARVLASPLDRTAQTAAAVAAAQRRPPVVELDDAFVEIDMGEWTGRRLDGFGDDPAWRAWNERRATARIPGGESMGEAQARIVARLAALATTETEDATIAVVSHADMIRGAVAHVLGLSLDDILRFDVDPASVTRVVWGRWGARLMSLNEKAT